MENTNASVPVDAAIMNSSSGPLKRSTWIVLGCGAVMVFCCCGGFVGVAAYVIRMGGDEDAQKVVELVKDHPLVLEKLGGIEECKKNYAASMTEGGKRTDVFDVRGPKGKAQFVTFQLFYEFQSVKLRTKEGEVELLENSE